MLHVSRRSGASLQTIPEENLDSESQGSTKTLIETFTDNSPPLPRYQRRRINNDDLIASIDQVGQKLADCLSIDVSALDTLVQHRPPSDPDLSEAARETLGVTALPFGFTNAVAIYQDALRGKFTD